VANLRVAVTQRIQQDGEWRDGDTSFLRVNVWRGQAEHLADSLAKGDRVMVTGRLRQRSWETPEGNKRSVTEIEADEVGASLKWATAKIERTSQRGNGERSSGRERQTERASEGARTRGPHPYHSCRRTSVVARGQVSASDRWIRECSSRAAVGGQAVSTTTFSPPTHPHGLRQRGLGRAPDRISRGASLCRDYGNAEKGGRPVGLARPGSVLPR
jgi:single-strand DNA-binding protein